MRFLVGIGTMGVNCSILSETDWNAHVNETADIRHYVIT